MTKQKFFANYVVRNFVDGHTALLWKQYLCTTMELAHDVGVFKNKTKEVPNENRNRFIV
tara:strand:- start:3062 stop:3238 length:177 start_codon:yes stop_codon:yes gene_type:complete